MSWVHGSVNPIVGGGLRGLPWTDGNGGWRGSLEELGARCSRMWELNVFGVCVCVCVCEREREIAMGLCSWAAKGGGGA
jgi:hypothetical protein